MAKVKPVHTCRACGAELKTADQLKCHVCGTVLKTDPDAKFASPDYLMFQFQELENKLDAKSRDLDKNKKAIDEDLVVYLRNCPEDEKNAAMYDAFFHMKFLVQSTASVDTIRSVVKMGIRIGKLAESIDQYIKNQGAINVSRQIDTSEPGDGDESPGNS